MVGRGLPQLVAYLEGSRLLSFNSIRIERIHQGDGIILRDLPDDAQSLVEVSLNLDHLGTMEHRLGEFTQGNLPFRNDNIGPQTCPGGIGGR